MPLHKRNNKKITKIDKSIFILLFVYLLSAIVGLQNITSYPRQYIGDIAPVINLIAGFILIRIFIKNYKSTNTLIWMFLYIFGARALVGIIRNCLGTGYKELYGSVPFWDTVGAFPEFLIFIPLAFIFFGNINKSTKRFLFPFIFLGLTFLIMWPGRAEKIIVIIGLIFISIFMSFGKKMTFLIKGSILLTILILISFVIQPQMTKYSLWRLTTLQYLTKGIQGPATTSFRLKENVNIFYKLKEKSSLIWGEGAGGWFTEEYIPFNLKSSYTVFSEKERQEGKFFRPHELIGSLLLKNGFIGIFLYGLFFIIFTRIIFKKGWKTKNGFQRALFIGLYIPVLTQILIGTGTGAKNLIMGGILLGILSNNYCYTDIHLEKGKLN